MPNPRLRSASFILAACILPLLPFVADSFDFIPKKNVAVLAHDTEGGYRLLANNATVADVIEEISEVTGIEITVDEALADQKITCDEYHSDIESVLQAVSASHAMIYERVGDEARLVSAVVTSEQEEEQVEKEEVSDDSALARTIAARKPLPGTILSNSRLSLTELRRDTAQALLFSGAILDTKALVEEGRGLDLPEGFEAGPDTRVHIVQFDRPVSSADREALEALGARVSHYVPNRAYAVVVDAEGLDAIKDMAGVYVTEPYHPYFKMSQALRDRLVGGLSDEDATGEAPFTLMTFAGSSIADDLADAGITVQEIEKVGDREVVTFDTEAAQLSGLLADDDVQWIEPYVPNKPLNDLGAKRMRIPSLRQLHPSLDGEGVIVAVTDTGVDFLHGAFRDAPGPTSTNLNTRIAYYDYRDGPFTEGLPGDIDGHGTHVAGSVLGSGALSDTVVSSPGSDGPPYATNAFAGAAPRAKLVMLEDFNSFSDTEQAEIGYQQGARISNNSWGNSVHEYGVASATWDELVRDADSTTAGNQQFIVFFSAGNDGSGENDGGGADAGTIGQPGNAKNVITMGALEQPRYADNIMGVFFGDNQYFSEDESDSDWQVASFSSRGPVTDTDLRVKPDLVAPGHFVLSAQSRDLNSDEWTEDLSITDYRFGNVDTGTNYAYFSGTSMASPLGAGSAALLYQYITNLTGNAPSPALVKAALVAGARTVNSMVYRKPILSDDTDIVEDGWGLIDIARTVDGPGIRSGDEVLMFDQVETQPLETDQTYTYDLEVEADEGGLKIVLAYTDQPGTPGPGVQLVNNLDLIVFGPNGAIYRGNVFDVDGVHSYRLDNGDPDVYDQYNNVEVIVIPDTDEGNYSIRVYGRQVPSGPQDYALVVHKGIGYQGRTAGNFPAIDLDDQGYPVIAFSYDDFQEGIYSNLERQIFVRRWMGPYGDLAEIDQWKRLEDQWYPVGNSAGFGGISHTLENSEYPDIAVDGDYMYVAWEEGTQFDPESAITNQRIFVKKFDGTNWIQLAGSGQGYGISGNTNGYDAYRPVIDVMGDGSPVVAYLQDGFAPNVTRVMLKRWNGTNWVGLAGSDSNGIPTSAGTKIAESLSIAVNGLGLPVVAFKEQTNPDGIVVRQWNGASWVNLSPADSGPFLENPRIAAHPTSTDLALAWVQTYGAAPGEFQSYQVYAARWNGSWSAVGASQTFPGVSAAKLAMERPVRVDVGLGFNDVITAVWEAGTNTGERTVLARQWIPGNTNWTDLAGSATLPGITHTFENYSSPRVVVDPDGLPVVTLANTMTLTNLQEVQTYTVVSDREPPVFEGIETAVGGTNGTVTVGWSPAIDTISSTIVYQIYRSVTSVDCGTVVPCNADAVFSNLIAYVTNVTSYVVTGLTNDQLYCFGVRARDASGFVDDNMVTRQGGPAIAAGDGDGDCLMSAIELSVGTSPCIADTDGDGMDDGWEWFYSTNNVAHTNAFAMDPLDDGVINYRDYSAGDTNQVPYADPDGDGATSLEEFEWYVANYTACVNTATNLVSPDPSNPDTDGDGLDDGWEMIYGLSPVVPNVSTNDADQDGLSLLEEFQSGTDPNNPDTDRDGLYDGSWYPGNPFGGADLFEGDNGTDPTLTDTDFDGLDDGVEAAQGSSPIKAASIVSFLTDGDLYQLGWTNGAVTNFVTIHVNENFETSSRTNWTHNAPNAAMPFDFWHLSTAEPGSPPTNGVEYFNARSTNTAYRMANDVTTTNVDATYDIGGGVQSLIQNALYTPVFDTTNDASLFVQWNEYFETEPNADFVTVQARGNGNPNWLSISSVKSGYSLYEDPVSGDITTNWVNRTADLSGFAGMTNVQVRFLFSAQNAINNNFRGWWVDDVAIFGTRVITGWVRDNNGAPIEKATVYVIGRGGVKKVIGNQITIPPGKVFAETQTAEDGSFTLRNIFPGHIYIKAQAPGYAAEFYDGQLFTGLYGFGAGDRPGVADIDLVSTNGYVDIRTASFTNAFFELERGAGRAYLGVAFSDPGASPVPVYVDRMPAQVWNGVNTTGGAARVDYLSATNVDDLVLLRPDWESNAVSPVVMTELAAGSHWVQIGTNLQLVLPTFMTREAEKFLIDFSTNLAIGSVLFSVPQGESYDVWVDGEIIGATPLRYNLRVGPHKVSIVNSNLAHVALKSIFVHPGAENFVNFTTNELEGVVGSTVVKLQNVFGQAVTGGVIYLNGEVYATNESSSLTITNLLLGEHYVQARVPGFRLTENRLVRILSTASNTTLFTLVDSDEDYDLVGDRTEVVGYTNIYSYTRSDDPDADLLDNRQEFRIFEQAGIRLNPFDADTDGDGMDDGDEVGYDGLIDRFAYSKIAEQAVEGTNVLHSYFAGYYLSGIDNFGGPGAVIAAIECDRFEASSLSHSNEAMPSQNQALTRFEGIPEFGIPNNISQGHFLGSEILADTRPDLKDTDGDGMWDGFEFQYAFINSILVPGTSNRILDPLECNDPDADPDADGLSNYEEFLGPDYLATTNLDWTDPTDADTDDDGMPDGWEYTYGLNPNDPGDKFLDPDGDGLVNVGEFNLGSNPQLYDTDGDSLSDGQEAYFGTDPQDIDTDNDGLVDGREVWDADLDGTPDGGFFPNWAPGADFDNDGFVDGPTDFDTDGDGMPDGWEVFDSFGRLRPIPLNPFDPTDADDDPDNDGLSNVQEYLVQDGLYGNVPTDFTDGASYSNVVWDYGTDPFDPDSDGDGMPDGWEAINGLHPMDPIPDFKQGGLSALTNLYRYCAEGVYELCEVGDADGDGLANHREFVVRYALGSDASNVTVFGASTHPWLVDTDEDGLGDGEEDRSFANNPILQDTDGDRLVDGTGVANRFGEVWSTTNTMATNHFDQALNDLWILEIGGDDPILRWTQVTPSNSPPPGRWGHAMVYNPVFERQLVPQYGFCPFGHPVGPIVSERSDVVLMDNRQLIVLGGRDGVTRYDTVWQYSVASNIWVEATNNPSLLGEVSEFGAAIIFGHEPGNSDCFYANPGEDGDGKPAWRPWMTHAANRGGTVSQPYGAGTIFDLDDPNIWHASPIPGPPATPDGEVDITGNIISYETIAHRSFSFEKTVVFGGWVPLPGLNYLGGRGQVFKSLDDTNSFAVDPSCTHFGVQDQWGAVSGSSLILPQTYRPDGMTEYVEPKRNGLKSFAMDYAYRGLVNFNPTVGSAYSQSNLVVVFGGMSGKDIFRETIHLEPEWTLWVDAGDGQPVYYEFDELNWYQPLPQNSPPARWGAHMTYEPRRRLMVLFGGFDINHEPLNDLWIYDGDEWFEVTQFDSVERPQPRGGACFEYYGGHDYDRDWDRKEPQYNSEDFDIVLFGGTDKKVYFDDVWSLSIGSTSNAYTAEWTLHQPVGESREPRPSPRAFATMSWAQNAGEELAWPGYQNGPADGFMYVFGGRSGTLPTGVDTDRDLVNDGREYELGGPDAGRDPRVNKLVVTNSLTETVPFSFLRMGSVVEEPNFVPPTSQVPNHAIANFEAISYDCSWGGANIGIMLLQNQLPWMGFNLTAPDYLCENGVQFPTFDAPPWDVGVEAYRADFTDLWYSQYSFEFPFDERNEWELGRPIPDDLGTNGAPPYAYSGRWVYGTDLDGTYPNDAQMELLSPLMRLVIPPVDATSTNYDTRFNLIFHEWLDLADSNDTVRVEMIRPVTGSEINKRISNPNKPVITLVPDRNSAYNTDGEWRRVIVPIEISANETNVYFKFSFRSDASGNAGGWYIDDVAVIQASEISGTYSNALETIQLLGQNFNGYVQDETVNYNDLFQFGLLPLGNYQIAAGGATNAFILTGPGLVTNIVAAPAAPDVIFTDIGKNSDVVITWAASNTFVYKLDFTTNILANAWSNLAVRTGGVGGTISYTDTITGVDRIYRVYVTNAP